ncbi:MAG: ATP-binding protein, partial [Candidatus Zixiibacteriota bacterium]
QLLVNLIYNASDALAEQEGDRNISISSQLVKKSGEQKVIIEVHDNGPGVAKDKEHLLFKKRFTSKRKGHGIGLITCKKIIDAHNGRVAYKYDKGATFYFELSVNQQTIMIEKSESEPSQVST